MLFILCWFFGYNFKGQRVKCCNVKTDLNSYLAKKYLTCNIFNHFSPFKLLPKVLVNVYPGVKESFLINATRGRLSVNSLWHSDAIWQHRSGSTLAQVLACCVMAPSHYLNLSLWSSDIHIKTISITKINLKNSYLKFHLNVPGVNELRCLSSHTYLRADSRFLPSQWETLLQSNATSHWLGANLVSALYLHGGHFFINLQTFIMARPTALEEHDNMLGTWKNGNFVPKTNFVFTMDRRIAGDARSPSGSLVTIRRHTDGQTG